MPKDNQTLTLVLGGIRAPRTARNPSEKSEPYGEEAFEFSTRRYMQRDVEFAVEALDKAGGFIGALFANKTENAAVALVRAGLAHVHAGSADALPYARELADAEEARAGRDLVPERAPDLRGRERHLAVVELEQAREVEEVALRRFRPQVAGRRAAG